jgi:hypothetical protein
MGKGNNTLLFFLEQAAKDRRIPLKDNPDIAGREVSAFTDCYNELPYLLSSSCSKDL